MLFIIISYIPYITTKELLFGHICKYIADFVRISIVFVRMSYYNSRGYSIESPLPAMSL